MRFLSLAMAISVSSLIIIGCGGGGSTPDPDDLQPTGELKKEDADKTLKLLEEGLDPSDTLREFSENDAKSSRFIDIKNKFLLNKRVIAVASEEDNNTEECLNEGGTYSWEFTGDDYWDSNKTSGEYIYKYIAKNCTMEMREEGNITENGIWIYNVKWEKKNDTLNIEYTYKTDGEFEEKIDNTHYTKYTMDKTGKKNYKIEEDNFYYLPTIYFQETKKFSGKIVWGDQFIDLKNIVREKEIDGNKYNSEEDIKFTQKWQINGLVGTEYTNGYIKIETKTALEANQDDFIKEDEYGDKEYCEHKGLITFTDASNNILSLEALANHNIVVKYNNEELERYNDCTELE